MSSKNDSSWVSRVLDRFFGNKRLSFWIPLVTAAAMYVLFLIFGDMPGKWDLALVTLIVAPVAFGGVYLICCRTIRRPSAFIRVWMLIAACIFGLGAVFFGISFLGNLKTGYTPTIVASMVIWSALSVVYHRQEQT